MLGVFLIALLILAAAAAAAARRRQRRGAAGEVVRQPEDVERDVYEKLYGSHSSEGRIGEGVATRAQREGGSRVRNEASRVITIRHGSTSSGSARSDLRSRGVSEAGACGWSGSLCGDRARSARITRSERAAVSGRPACAEAGRRAQPADRASS
jgi:hypothetical protein